MKLTAESYRTIHISILTNIFLVSVTLHDIVHTEKSLTLVFEYLEKGRLLAIQKLHFFGIGLTASFQKKPRPFQTEAPIGRYIF